MPSFSRLPDVVRVDQTVYDQDRARVGYVDQADAARGWMEVRAGELQARKLWIPYRLVRSVEDREIFLAATSAELRRDHSTPPPRTTSVAALDGRQVAITTEPSGYDGEPIRVHEVEVNHIKELLAVGQRVWTSDDVELGSIKQFDDTGGYLVIEKGALARRHDLLVPVVLVADVNRDAAEAMLAVTQADLNRMQHLEPVNVVINLPAVSLEA